MFIFFQNAFMSQATSTTSSFGGHMPLSTVGWFSRWMSRVSHLSREALSQPPPRDVWPHTCKTWRLGKYPRTHKLVFAQFLKLELAAASLVEVCQVTTTARPTGSARDVVDRPMTTWRELEVSAGWCRTVETYADMLGGEGNATGGWPKVRN